MGIDKAKQKEIEKANEDKIAQDDKLFLEQMQRPIPEVGFQSNNLRLSVVKLWTCENFSLLFDSKIFKNLEFQLENKLFYTKS